MCSRAAPALIIIVLSGCHQPVADAPLQRDAAGTVIGLEATEPELEERRYRIDTQETLSEHYTADQLAQLPVGEMCTAELSATGRVIRGRIAKVSDELLVLSDAEEITVGTSNEGVPMVDHIPYVQRLFKNTGIGTVQRYLGPETISAFEIDDIVVERQVDRVTTTDPAQES